MCNRLIFLSRYQDNPTQLYNAVKILRKQFPKG